MHKIIVIGGGTGSYVVLSGLKQIPDVQLTAIVPATDSGGSSGRLKDEFGYLPVGDVRQCLVAMADSAENEDLLRRLFSYRFERGESGLKGHNFGNLFLTALSEVLGDEIAAIKMVRKMMNIRGSVFPVSLERCDLIADYENGQQIKGEHLIEEPVYPHDGRLRITKLRTEPEVQTHAHVTRSIAQADLIVMGPGDLYTSLLANLVIPGVAAAVAHSRAKLVYIMNLVTRYGQTYSYTAHDHLSEVERYLGRPVDYILMNNTPLPSEVVERYRLQNDEPVVDDLGRDKRVIQSDLLATEQIVTSSGDVLKRSLIRHDSQKLSKLIAHIFTVLETDK